MTRPERALRHEMGIRRGAAHLREEAIRAWARLHEETIRVSVDCHANLPRGAATIRRVEGRLLQQLVELRRLVEVRPHHRGDHRYRDVERRCHVAESKSHGPGEAQVACCCCDPDCRVEAQIPAL